jgi:hypothetical protein
VGLRGEVTGDGTIASVPDGVDLRPCGSGAPLAA